MTVLTGSMEPVISPGDMIVVRGVDSPADVRVGDVVTFQPVSNDPALITHRVVEKRFGSGSGVSFVTRGDANGADDDPIVFDQVVGEYVYHVPFVGRVALWAGGHTEWVVPAVGGVLLLYAVSTFFSSDGSRRRDGDGDGAVAGAGEVVVDGDHVASTV